MGGKKLGHKTKWPGVKEKRENSCEKPGKHNPFFLIVTAYAFQKGPLIMKIYILKKSKFHIS